MSDRDEIIRMAREANLLFPGVDTVDGSVEQLERFFHLAYAAALRRLSAVEAQRDALLEALKEYGWHHEGCPQYPLPPLVTWPACTCGFDAAIKAVEEQK